jgi:hypothetical protein
MCVILFAQSEDPPTEKVYRSFYNQTITLTCYSPDKAIKKRYCLFIDTTKTSIFYQKLIERIEFDDYQLSLIERVCRDFKKAKKIKSLWSFKDDERLKNLKEKWIQVQRLNNQTYLFYANDYKNTSFFHLTDSTVVISKKGFPETFFIKNIQNLPYSTLIECFNGIKFTFRILDAKTNLSVLKTECYKPDYKVSYELVIPNKSFKNYNMIVNHSAAGKIPDDILFDEIDFDYISAYIGSITER